MKTHTQLYIVLLVILVPTVLWGQTTAVNVDINLNIKHSVNGVSDFGRERHMTIHSNVTDPEWEGHEDMMDYLINDLDVYFGRDNGTASWKSRLITEDPNRAHWPDTNSIRSVGEGLNQWYESDDYVERHQYESRRNSMIMGMNPQPIYPTIDWSDYGKTNSGWQTYDVDAGGFWTAHFLDKNFSKNDDEIGEPLPKYWECINEPDMTMLGAAYMFVTSPEKIFEFHNKVAEETRALLGENAPKIGGMTWGQHDFFGSDYTWRMDPQFYYDNSDPALHPVYDNMLESNIWEHRSQAWFQWDGMWQGFIDAAGANMDFYSVHFYDWPEANNGGTIRAGGQIEASLDLLEWYDWYKFGEVKEIVISEFGSVAPYVTSLPYKRRDWENLRPFNQMFMQFLERPSHLSITMPFAPVKATWGDIWNDNGTLNERYPTTLMDPVGNYTAPGNEHPDWEWSGIIKFFELWSDVKGTRVETKSDNLDIQVDAYVNGNHLYLILNNLEIEAQTINLNMFDDHPSSLQSVHIKHQYLDETLGTDGLPVNAETTLGTAPGSVVLAKSATMILDYQFELPITIDEEVQEKKYMSEALTSETNMIGGYKVHADLGGRTALTTSVNNVIVPTIGEAVLRIGNNCWNQSNVIITINGQTLMDEDDPKNWRGRIDNKGAWFGVFEVEVPIEFLQENNAITCQNNSNNAQYSSVQLQVFDFSKEPGRSTEGDGVPVTDISLASPISVMQGQTKALSVGFTPLNATNKKITWSSSNSSVATVDGLGVVTAISSSGSAIISATCEDGPVAVTTINATPYTPTPVTGLEITSGDQISAEYYTNTALNAVISPSDATVQEIVWSSSNPEEVYVNSETGKVTGKKVNATATITATVTDTASGNTTFTDQINVHVTIVGPERTFCRELPDLIRPYPSSEVTVPVRTMGSRNVAVELSRNGTLIGEGSLSFEHYGDTTLSVPYDLLTTPQIETDYTFTVRLLDGSTELDVCSESVYMADHFRAESVQIVEGIRLVQVGTTIQLEAEVLPENTYNKDVSWNSTNPSIASVDVNSGVVSGVSAGTTYIQVTSDDGGFTDAVQVTVQTDSVHIYMDSIFLPDEILIFPGTTAEATYTFSPKWATDTVVTWNSSATNIANINATGLITTNTIQGTATITATSVDVPSVSASTVVTVSETIVVEAEGFAETGGPYDGFDTYETEEGVGGINMNQSGDWGDYEVEFPVSGEYSVKYFIGAPDGNTDIGVNIYLNGILQSTTTLSSTGGWDVFGEFSALTNIAVTAGTHTIRIESTGGSEWQWNMDRFELTREGGGVPVTGVSLTPETALIDEEGETVSLSATIAPPNATNQLVGWSSNNTGVAIVNGSGVVSAVSNGSAYIIVTTNDGGFKDTCIVTVDINVTPIPVDTVTVSPAALTLDQGESYSLSATIEPSNATNQNVSWSSDNLAIVSVNNSGLVTANGAGVATITVTTEDGNKTAISDITVTEDTVIQTGDTIIIEAEDYTDMGGVNQNGTRGGKVGTIGSITYMYEIIDTDWLEYTFDVATAGTYSVEFVAGSDRADQNIEYILDGNVIATQLVNQTGSQTVFATTQAATDLNLSVGSHTLRLVAAGTYIQWTLDKILLINGDIINIPVESVSLSETSLTLNVDQTADLNETITPPDATNQDVNWSSDNSGVATVNDNGLVTAISIGSATITVTTDDGGHTATCNVTVEPIDVIAVSLTPVSATLYIGETRQLTESISPPNATNQNVSWSSDNSVIAMVDANGLVTAMEAGSAIITVTTEDGNKTATSNISVMEDTVTQTGDTIIIEAEDYADMGGVNQNGTWGGKVGTIGSITYMYEIIDTDWLEYTFDVATAGTYSVEFVAGSDRANQNIEYILDGNVIATQLVNQTGSQTVFGTTQAATDLDLSVGSHTLRLVATGTYIQWTLDKIRLINGDVTIIPVESVSLSETSLTLNVDQTADLNESITPPNATNQDVSWSSDNSGVATVNANGLVTAVSIGSATITVTTDDGGHTATCNVTVDPVGAIDVTITPVSAELTVGETLQLIETVLPTNATDKSVSWSSDNVAVATVNSNGLVTAESDGTANIVVTTLDGGFTASSAISVQSVVDPYLAVDDFNKYLTTKYEVGGTLDVVANYEAGDGNTVTNTYNGIQFWLRELRSDWSPVNDIIIEDNSAIGQQTGTATASFSLEGLTPSADLPNGNFYFIWVRFMSSDGTVFTVDGLAPVQIVDPVIDVELTIQAEDFVETGGAYGGFQTYFVGDVEAINWNQTGDWGDYSVNVPESGLYDVEYFVGTTVTGAAIEFILNGTTIMTDDVPNNGNWDDFVSLQAAEQVSLDAGQQTIRLLGAGTHGWEWNMDRFVLTYSSGAKSGKDIDESLTGQLEVYPIPVENEITVRFVSNEKEQMRMVIYDQLGKVYMIQQLTEEYQTIDVSHLQPGMYILQVNTDYGVTTKRFIKN